MQMATEKTEGTEVFSFISLYSVAKPKAVRAAQDNRELN